MTPTFAAAAVLMCTELPHFGGRQSDSWQCKKTSLECNAMPPFTLLLRHSRRPSSATQPEARQEEGMKTLRRNQITRNNLLPVGPLAPGDEHRMSGAVPWTTDWQSGSPVLPGSMDSLRLHHATSVCLFIAIHLSPLQGVLHICTTEKVIRDFWTT